MLAMSVDDLGVRSLGIGRAAPKGLFGILAADEALLKSMPSVKGLIRVLANTTGDAAVPCVTVGGSAVTTDGARLPAVDGRESGNVGMTTGELV
jgi:hypothetical protein